MFLLSKFMKTSPYRQTTFLLLKFQGLCCGFVFSSPTSRFRGSFPVATACMVALVWLLPFHTFGTHDCAILSWYKAYTHDCTKCNTPSRMRSMIRSRSSLEHPRGLVTCLELTSRAPMCRNRVRAPVSRVTYVSARKSVTRFSSSH